MVVFLDVLPRLGLTEAEVAFDKLKQMALKTGKEMGLSIGDGATAGLKRLEEEAVNAERVVSDANRKMIVSSQQYEAQVLKVAEVEAARGRDSAAYAAAMARQTDLQMKATAATADHSAAAAGAAAASGKFAAAEDAKGAAVVNTTKVLNGVGMASFLAFGAAVAVSADKAADFEQSQTKLVASAGETARGMKQTSDGILQMAGSVGYTAGQLSDAMYVVEKGGFSAAKGGLDVLKAAAQGANAEQADLAEVTKGLTISMNDFHFPTQNAADVMSKLVVATGASTATFQEFTGALHSVEPAAAAAGIKYEDLLAVISQGTKSGASADQVTENIRNAINALSGAQKPARDAMAQMGISADDVSQHLGQRGLAGTMQYLSDTIKSRLDPNNLIDVGTFKQNAQELDNMNASLAAMSPSAQAAATGLRNGTVTAKEFLAAIKGSSGDDTKRLMDFRQWSNDLDDFSKRFKNGQSTLETYNQALRDMTGTVAGQTIALQVTGENADATNNLIAKLTGTTREHDGTVKGFNETQETLNAKLRDAKAGFGAAATEMGEVFIPTLKSAADGLKATAEFLAAHKDAVRDAVIAVGLLGTTWAAVKIGLAAQTTWNAIATGIDLAITKMAALRVASTETAAVVEADAAAEATAITGIGAAALSAAGYVAALAFGIKKAFDYANEHKTDPDAIDRLQGNQSHVPGWVHNATLAIPIVGSWLNMHLPGEGEDPARGDDDGKVAGDYKSLNYDPNMPGGLAAAPFVAPTPGGPMPVATAPFGPDPGTPGGEIAAGGGSKAPKGDKNDPIWIAPQNASDFKSDTDHGITGSSIITSGPDFSPKGIATYFSALLIDLAVGNPIGKTLADKQKRGDTAQNPMYVTSVDVDSAQKKLDEALHNYGPDSTEAKNAAAKLDATKAAVGTTGGYYDPKTGAPVSGGSATVPTGGSSARDANAADIIRQAQAMGFNKEQTLAALGVGIQETDLGTNPRTNVAQNQSGTVVQGEFQQDGGYTKYGDRTNPSNSARGFLTEFANRGQGLADPNPWRHAVSDVQIPAQAGAGGYNDSDGSYLRTRQRAAALDYYNRLAPDAADPSTGGGGGGGGWGNGGGGGSILEQLSSQFTGGGGEGPVFKRSPGDPAPGTDGSSLFSPGGILGGGAPGGAASTFGNIGMPPGTPGGQTTGFNPLNALATNGGQPGVGARAGGGSPFGTAPGGNAPGGAPGVGAGVSNAPRSWGSGKGASVSIGSSIISAAGPLAAMAPGSAQAAQLIDRTIGYGAQVGGIAVEGLMQSLIPTGGGGGIGDPSHSLIGKIAGGVAGAHKSAPNSAGTTAPPLPAKDDDKNKPQQPAGDTTHVGTQNTGTVVQGDMHVTTPDAQSFASDKPQNIYPTATR